MLNLLSRSSGRLWLGCLLIFPFLLMAQPNQLGSVAAGTQRNTPIYGQADTVSFLVTLNRRANTTQDFTADITNNNLPSGVTADPLTISLLGTDNTSIGKLILNIPASIPAGTYTFTVSATNSVDNADQVISGPVTLLIQKANQTITFGALAAKTFGDPLFSPGASASSGLAVSYTSSNTSVATISGGSIQIAGAGSTVTLD